MNIELRHLRTIMAIHAAGSVAQAAEQLHITQSALSHQIKAIRDQLGVDLVCQKHQTDAAFGRRLAVFARCRAYFARN
jgi:DNA-binding transcriptional LysR family regulator